MKKKMILTTLIFLLGLIAFAVAYYFTQKKFLYPLAITCGTAFFHLAVRLAVGYLIDATYHNKMNFQKKWFCEKRFERKFYDFLRVKKWKKFLPTFSPENFQMSNRPVEEIIQVTCQSEIVHEVNMVLSFVPVLFSIWFGSLAVFLATSCAAFLFDSIFVIMQRYNRPRLLRLLKKQQSDR